MRINIKQLPLEGLTLEEEVGPAGLDLETDLVKFREPVKLKAHATKITNAVIVDLAINAAMSTGCSRCLEEFKVSIKKEIRLSYPVEKSETVIDLSPDIREEIILDYPLRPLCKPDCQGLCPKCGKNLNEGDCKCVSA